MNDFKFSDFPRSVTPDEIKPQDLEQYMNKLAPVIDAMRRGAYGSQVHDILEFIYSVAHENKNLKDQLNEIRNRLSNLENPDSGNIGGYSGMLVKGPEDKN